VHRPRGHDIAVRYLSADVAREFVLADAAAGPAGAPCIAGGGAADAAAGGPVEADGGVLGRSVVAGAAGAARPAESGACLNSPAPHTAPLDEKSGKRLAGRSTAETLTSS